mmetsp:Transcript_117507/g.339739  ORF Transcript_117507/g.339739 Transcript_117507/m.339739 type:complete len:220 (-) Transcript_117507:1378-2037(-)
MAGAAEGLARAPHVGGRIGVKPRQNSERILSGPLRYRQGEYPKPPHDVAADNEDGRAPGASGHAVAHRARSMEDRPLSEVLRARELGDHLTVARWWRRVVRDAAPLHDDVPHGLRDGGALSQHVLPGLKREGARGDAGELQAFHLEKGGENLYLVEEPRPLFHSGAVPPQALQLAPADDIDLPTGLGHQRRQVWRVVERRQLAEDTTLLQLDRVHLLRG